MRDILLSAVGTVGEVQHAMRQRVAELRRDYPQSTALVAALGDEMRRRIDAMPHRVPIVCSLRIDVQCDVAGAESTAGAHTANLFDDDDSN